MSRRYIDAEALIQEVIESKHSYLGDPMMVSQHDLMCDNTISWIDGAETADMVEVVWCKDCKHSSDRNGYDVCVCKKWEAFMDKYGFCHCGKRREE